VVENRFLTHVNGEFVPQDARLFLNNTHDQFDVVVSDVYSNISTIPSHLVTQEYFASIARVLNSNGYFIANIIAKPQLQDSYSKRLDNTIRSVFHSCVTFPMQYSSTITNIIYVCPKPTLEEDNSIYTDDRNTVTLDQY
jgi:spermidine synthase